MTQAGDLADPGSRTIGDRIRALLVQPLALVVSIAALAVIVSVYVNGRVLAATILLVVFAYAWSARGLVEGLARRLPALSPESKWKSSAEATAALAIVLPLAVAGLLASLGRGYWDLLAYAFGFAMLVTLIANWQPTHRMRRGQPRAAPDDLSESDEGQA